MGKLGNKLCIIIGVPLVLCVGGIIMNAHVCPSIIENENWATTMQQVCLTFNESASIINSVINR